MRVTERILNEMILRIQSQSSIIVREDGSPVKMPKPLSKAAQNTPVLDILLDLRDARAELATMRKRADDAIADIPLVGRFAKN